MRGVLPLKNDPLNYPATGSGGWGQLFVGLLLARGEPKGSSLERFLRYHKKKKRT